MVYWMLCCGEKKNNDKEKSYHKNHNNKKQDQSRESFKLLSFSFNFFVTCNLQKDNAIVIYV